MRLGAVEGFYRLTCPGHLVKQARPDWDVQIYQPGAVMGSMNPNGSLAAVYGLDLDGIDLLIQQRVGKQVELELGRAVQARGGAVILDADDAMWAIHKDNAAYKVWNHPRSGIHWSLMDQAAKEADLVTVTTQALAARYGKHGRVEILPNRVPAAATNVESVKDPDSPVTFGWSGFVATHPADLHVMGDSAQRVLEDCPEVHGRIVGDARGIQEAWGLDLDRVGDRISATGAVKFDNYHMALTLLDVGVVPLERSVFNSAKSGLKAAEYAAQGVPSVVTPTPANRALAREGYPLVFAENPGQWYDALRVLVSHADARAEAGAVSLDVAKAHTLENHIGEWVSAWERAVSRRARLTA